jgi:hypothetical protein
MTVAPEARGLLAEHRGSARIDRAGPVGFGFGPVDRGVRRRVHDHVGCKLAHQRSHRGFIREIALRTPYRANLAQRRQRALQFETDLPVLSRQ